MIYDHKQRALTDHGGRTINFSNEGTMKNCGFFLIYIYSIMSGKINDTTIDTTLNTET